MRLNLQMQHQWFIGIINLVINFTRCSFNIHGSFLLLPAVSSHLGTRPRPTMEEPRPPGPKLHPGSPDWAATATKRPDLNPRAATFNPRSIWTIISHCKGWGQFRLDCDMLAPSA